MSFKTAREAFSADTYDTPADTRRYWGDRVLLQSRWWFYLLFVRDVLIYGPKALRGKYDEEMLLKTTFQVFKYIEGCGGRFHIKGLDHLRNTKEPLVIVSNHMSTMEALILPCIITPFRPVTYVVKKSLVNGRLFAPLVRAQKPIVVSRTNPREDFRLVMEQGQQALENGLSLVIFPQATRSIKFNPEKFNTLGVKLARNAGVRILPLAIKTDFWGHSKIIKGFGPLDRKKPIYMTFGEPINIKGNGKDEHQQIIRFIGSHLEKWQEPANPESTD